jgi:hypothetical protein
MYRTLLSVFSLSAALFSAAQSYVHQVLVLNEGYFNWQEQQQVVPVTLGSFDPATNTYQVVATIEGSRFASDVLVSGTSVYVAADDRLLKFDSDMYSLLAQAELPGIRKIAIWNDKLLITRGEIGGLPHYFEVRDAGTLEFITAITPADGLPHSIEDVVVADDKAWLGVNNAFQWGQLTGYIAIVDLGSMTLDASVDLGPQGLNPEKLMVTGDAVYVLNNTDFTASTISKISRQSQNLTFTQGLAMNSGCGASVLAGDQEKIYFMEYAVNTLARYDVTTDVVQDTLNNSISAYGLADDPINGVMYATTTDFFSTGDLHVMQYDGTVTTNVPVGVSPGHLALDIRLATSIGQMNRPMLSVSPNPAVDRLRISGVEEYTDLMITDASGRVVLRNAGTTTGAREVDVHQLAPGIYMVQVNGMAAARFVKQ